MRLRHLHETNSSIQLVGVSGAEQEKPYVTNLGMIDRCLHNKCSNSLTSD
jgi:hypothetical protein